MSNWKKIWNDRELPENLSEININDTESTFAYLKEMQGVKSVIGNGVAVRNMSSQFEYFLKNLSFSANGFEPTSFFDVGCGTGAYLYLLRRKFEKCKVGGIDYSETFLKTAKYVIKDPEELYCADAVEIDTDIKYDIVYSRSIFQYFENIEYAAVVVQKMLDKCNHSIGIFDVHDLRKKDEFINYRKSIIADYESKYSETPHLFLPKEMFLDIAEKNGCSIKISPSVLPGYWNERFTFDVYIYKQ